MTPKPPRPADAHGGERPLIVAHVLPWQSVGGVEIATLRVAEACESPEIHNIAFCVPGAGPVAELFQRAGLPAVTYARPVPSYHHGWRFWKESRELADLFRRHRVSVVHCSDLTSAPWAALAGKLAGCKVLCHIRNRFEHIPRHEMPFLIPIDRFVFVSRDSWRRFGYAVSARKGAVLYDGLPPADENCAVAASEVRREFGFDAGDLIVGMTARIAPQKDHETLLAAARMVRQKFARIRLLLVGDFAAQAGYRAQYEKLRRIVTETGLESVCVFTGFRTDVARLTAAMDIFVLSTHQEGLPLVLLEAMSLGRPVIATDVDGVPEVIDGSTGVLTPHQDA